MGKSGRDGRGPVIVGWKLCARGIGGGGGERGGRGGGGGGRRVEGRKGLTRAGDPKEYNL